MTIRVFLENTDKFTAVDNNVSVIGATGGTQRVVMAAGVTGLLADANVERFDLSGNLADYRLIAIAGIGLQIQDAAGVVITTIPSINGTAGLTVAFANGSAVLTQTGGSAFALGGVAVSITAATAIVATLNAAELSASAAATTVVNAGQTFTLTSGADLSGNLLGSAGTASTVGADTFTATQATYTTDDVLIGGDGADVLTITATASVVGRASTVAGIEIVNVNSSGLFAASYDANGVLAVGTTINLANATSTGSFAVTNLGTGATVGATGVSGALSITTTAATTQTLTLAANTAASQTVVLTGTSGLTDTATVTAAGTVALNTAGTAQIETVNLSGNGAAATFTMTGTPTTTNVTGTQSVIVQGDGDLFQAKTLAGSTTGTATTTLKLTADTTAGADLSKVSVGLVDLAFASVAATYNVKAGQAIKVSTANTAGMTFDIEDAVTGTNSTGAISIDLGVAVAATAGLGITLNATADTITALTLTNSTAAQSFELIAGTLADVTVSGTKALTLEADSTAKSIVATGLSGVLTVNYDSANDIATVTGGSGNDIFTNATTAITAATINGGAGNDTFTMVTTAVANLDGGDGTGDKLVLAGTNNASGLTLSNIEVISLTGTGAATFKASQLSGKAFVVTGDTAADKIIVGGANLLIDSATVDLSTLVLDTANVTTTEITLTAAAQLSNTLAVGGAFTFKGTEVIDTVNVSALTGANSISTGAGADIITGGSGADTITAGEGIDAITGGAGADSIILTEITAAVDTVTLASGTAGAIGVTTSIDSITGFTAASDVLSISNGAQTGSAIYVGAGSAIGNVAANNLVVQHVTTATTATFGATSGVLVLDYTVANAAALVTAIGTTAATLVTQGTSFTANGDFIIVWTDGTNSHVGLINDANSGANAVLLAADLTYTELATLTGLASVAGLTTADFSTIA